jgi:hypothetical protein
MSAMGEDGLVAPGHESTPMIAVSDASANTRRIAVWIFSAALALSVLLVALSFWVPALLWCRLALLGLGSVAGDVLWPKRRRDWILGRPDTAWLLRESLWLLAYATVGLAMSALDSLPAGQ